MKREIAEALSLLHDGLIISAKKDEVTLRFDVAVDFLANKINPNFTFFSIVVFEPTNIEFIDWAEDHRKYTDLQSILQFIKGIWITSCDTNDDGKICIHGHGGNSNNDKSCGGSLVFECKKIMITDETGCEISIQRLQDLYQLYQKE